MAQGLKVLTTFAEDLVSIPRNHTVPYRLLQFKFEGVYDLLAYPCTVYSCGTCSDMQA